MKEIRLRPYQVDGVKNLRLLFRKYKRIVAVAPTGSGKTTVAVALILGWPKRRVLWVAHRIELLRQAREELLRAGISEEDVGILSGPEKIHPEARILLASVDMFRARVVPSVDLIVVDEAHRVMADSYQNLIFAKPKALVLGLTATPERLDGQPLGDVFDHMLVLAETVELVADGYLAHVVTYGIPRDKARAIVSGVRAGKDYAVGALGKAMSKRALLGDLVEECGRLAPRERTLVFAVNREHGKALLERFLKAGRSAEYLDGETPIAARSAMVGKGGRLDSGETEVIINVDVLTEGFDCAAVSCIVMARPTKSLTRYMQPIGRAARPHGRKKAKLLDHAGNCWRHGLPGAVREWSLDGSIKHGGTRAAPVRLCPDCEAMIAASSRECPECGAALAPAERDLMESPAELVIVDPTEGERRVQLATLQRLAAIRGLPKAWVDGAMRNA